MLDIYLSWGHEGRRERKKAELERLPWLALERWVGVHDVELYVLRWRGVEVGGGLYAKGAA